LFVHRTLPRMKLDSLWGTSSWGLRSVGNLIVVHVHSL
jgi:hypothetical protein